ncbi:NAD-binding protein [Fomitiporia mediterranea MF3/22]|uniref:NAD-binding protein n=1 Tax=Fomitiporia mediterranea (strain MF3/22) TaxID=694068 RepID=UPI000440907F|nr:NAD-binding protein [Fomitiporia mediterranea MF3/22]EJD00702.1 NAD-binding protein [Fomitiporia mediterranea MF3/22]
MANSTQNSSATPTPLVGVEAAVRAAADPTISPIPTLLQKEFSLEGRVAIVTGGRRGLGLEMAAALAEAGATVYCLAASEAPTEDWLATQAYISKLSLVKSARLEYARVDVSNQTAVWEVIEAIAKREGRLDICVASAGIAEFVPCLDMTADQYERIMNVNVNGLFYTAQGAARQMKRLETPGSIVLVTSAAGSAAVRGIPVAAYSVTKAAGIQMARSLACELGLYGIRVNSLSPGYFPTDIHSNIEGMDEMHEFWKSQNPPGRAAKPAELRGVIAWLASDTSSFCTGSDIIVDGGHRAW